MSDIRARIEQLLQLASGTAGATTTDALKKATEELQTIYKRHIVVPPLIEIALDGVNQEVKQLAAVECRKRIAAGKNNGWKKTAPHTRNQIKARLLHQLDTNLEQSEKVRHALSRVIAAIAEIEIGTSQWPEILPWLWNSAGSSNVEQRKNGLYCLSSVLEALFDDTQHKGADAFSAHAAQLYPLFGKTIHDPESLEVRMSTIKSLGIMSAYVGVEDVADTAQLQQLIPGILSVLEACVNAQNEEGVNVVVDNLETMGLSEAPLINEHIAPICAFALSASINEDLDTEMRCSLLNLVSFVVRYKKSKIQSSGLAKQLLEGLLPIAALDDAVDIDEDSPSKAAIRIIDTLANCLPPSHVVDPLIALCQQYSQSADPRHRKAAIASFGSIFEGCSAYLQPHLETLWPFVERCLADEDARVRKAACIAVACMCEVLGEECATRHAQLLPLIVNLTQYPETQQVALAALDTLVESLGKGVVVPYLPSLMERLLALLATVGQTEQASVVGAIGSAAHAAKGHFTPYFKMTMDAFMPLLSLEVNKDSAESAEAVRGSTQDTVGTLAKAVGRQAFEPYFASCMSLALQGASIESASLRECSYIFFAIIARVYKADFAHFLPVVVPMLLASIIREDPTDQLFNDTAANNGAVASARTQTNDSEDYIDDGDSIESFDLAAHSALAVEKEVACDALGELFEHTGEAFVPYVPKALEHLAKALAAHYEGLRKGAANTLLSFIGTANDLTQPAKWTPGPSPSPLHGQVQQLANSVMPAIVDVLCEDDEREVIQSLLDDFVTVIARVGPALILPYLDKLCPATLLILQRKAPCQIQDQADDAEPDQELAELDGMLIRSAAELVSSLAAALGPAFSSAFSQFLPALAAYFDPKSASSERAGVIGVLAECCNGLQGGTSEFTDALIQLFAQALADPELDVRSNAAYAAGCLVFHSTIDLTRYYGSILSAINPLLTTDGNANLDVKNASDNACGCVARLLLKQTDAVPLDQLLPIYLAALPIKEDHRENAKVCESLCLLLRSGRFTPQNEVILSVLTRTLQRHRTESDDEEDPWLEPETVEIIRTNIRTSVTEAQAQASGVLAVL